MNSLFFNRIRLLELDNSINGLNLEEVATTASSFSVLGSYNKGL